MGSYVDAGVDWSQCGTEISLLLLGLRRGSFGQVDRRYPKVDTYHDY
jgi:hypothetical protein